MTCRLGLTVASLLVTFLVEGAAFAQDWHITGNSDATNPGTHFLGTTNNYDLQLKVYGYRALQLEPEGTNAPNIIGGRSNNSVTSGAYGCTIGGGGSSVGPNTVTDLFGTVGGGDRNQAGDGGGTVSDRGYATVGGGYYNLANGAASTVGGGDSNEASGSRATVAGGWVGTASAAYATVGGGYSNDASASGATIAGGVDSTASSAYGTVCGGYYNQATTEYYPTVGGGFSNLASAYAATVSGGYDCTASSSYSTIAGGRVNGATASYAAVGGGYLNVASATAATICGGYSNDVNVQYSTVAGGFDNTVGDGSGNGSYSTIGGGGYNYVAYNTYNTIGGGWSNAVYGGYATIGGGADNFIDVDASYSTIAGGDTNTIGYDGQYNFIGGGRNNNIAGPFSYATYGVVGGGYGNLIDGDYATIPGGLSNEADGDYSFAAGRRAKANSAGCFAWADSYDGDFTCGTTNRFQVRAGGGLYFYTSSNLSTYIYANTGEAFWSYSSDRDLKEGFEPVQPDEVLEKVAKLPITTWSLRASPTHNRHMGPMAQDFYAAFGLGDDPRRITSIDESGVAFAAIQGLLQRLAKAEARIAVLEKRAAEARSASDPIRAEVAGLLALVAVVGLGSVAVRRRGDRGSARPR